MRLDLVHTFIQVFSIDVVHAGERELIKALRLSIAIFQSISPANERECASGATAGLNLDNVRLAGFAP